MKAIECIHSLGGGGAERQLSYLPALLSARGWSLIGAIVRGGPHLRRFIDGGARVEWLRAAGNHDPRLFFSVARLIRRERPDLVHTWLPQMDVMGGMAALLSGVPWIMSERSSGDAYPQSWKNALRSRLAKRATAIVANSAGGARFWAARAPGVPVHVIPNALEVEEIDAAQAAPSSETGIRDGVRVVLAAGRCSPEKNQRLLIEALPRLDRDVEVVICGDGALLEETRTLARTLGVADRVHFPGFVESIWSWMKRADVFASVGWFEGHPNAVLEAMAAGRPVIVSDVEGHRDVVDRDAALFIDPASADDLAAAIRQTLNGSGLADRVERARSSARTFGAEAAAAAYDALYRQVAGRPR